MKFIDLLAKLGLLRFGRKKAVWHSGADIPEEILMNDIANAKRDLTTKKDIEALKETLSGSKEKTRFCTQCGEAVSGHQKFCSACGAEIER